MRRMIGGFAVALMLATVAIGAAPAAAWRGDAFEHRSVFPTPPDPWRHWGEALPGHRHAVRPHRFVRPGAVIVVPPQPVWVRDFWAWNGWQWVFIPGHWE